MDDQVSTAINAPNLFISKNGRRLAYRDFGSGRPIVLCTRFRANMDLWDPAFVDGLVDQGLRVITFDYSGLGLSEGPATYDPSALARDALDLIDALDLRNVIIGGWSLGGMAAQMVLMIDASRIGHAVLIGTTPPGPLVKEAEQLFFDTAVIPKYTLEHETILFFEPHSRLSREAAAHSAERIAVRTRDLSVPVDPVWAAANLGARPTNPIFPVAALLDTLKVTSIPILHIGGDHDIIFPVENWYALNGQLPTVQLLTFASAGHGPQHQHPEACAEYIASFARNFR
ncbi:MAG: alpha/beta hydrolase [Steroidobacteraceae bacterium]